MDPSIRRQRERERREWLARAEERDRLAAEQAARERHRVANLKNQWAQFTSARAHDLLAAYQRQTYAAKAQTLFSIARLINE
jgi:hypothetical protein